jgi:HK97 gp10 family phage protein
MPQFDFSIEGFEALERQLSGLEPKRQKRAYRNAASAAMLPVVRAAKSSAPVGLEAHKTYKGRWVSPGFLARSVRRKSMAYRDGSKFLALVGVAPEAFYGVQFLELGTRHIPRRPWLEPAYRSQSRDVVELFRKKLKHQIEKQAKQQVVG